MHSKGACAASLIIIRLNPFPDGLWSSWIYSSISLVLPLLLFKFKFCNLWNTCIKSIVLHKYFAFFPLVLMYRVGARFLYRGMDVSDSDLTIVTVEIMV